MVIDLDLVVWLPWLLCRESQRATGLRQVHSFSASSEVLLGDAPHHFLNLRLRSLPALCSPAQELKRLRSLRIAAVDAAHQQ